MTKGKIAKEIILWIIALFLALVCFRSGIMKMPGIPGEEFWIRDFNRWGYPAWFKIIVGLTELVAALLFLAPRVAGYGGAIFAAVMLGATFTHATHNEFGRLPFTIFLFALSLVIILVRQPKALRGFWNRKSVG